MNDEYSRDEYPCNVRGTGGPPEQGTLDFIALDNERFYVRTLLPTDASDYLTFEFTLGATDCDLTVDEMQSLINFLTDALNRGKEKDNGC